MDQAEVPRSGGGDRLAVNRRELLAVAGALLGALGLPGTGLAGAPAAAPGFIPIPADAFHDLSVALTGYSPRDPSLVAAFRDAFSAELNQLQQLYDIVSATPAGGWTQAVAGAGLSDLAEQLVLAWYTGIVGEGEEQRVLTYLDALVWYAVGYTKPPSTCDTDFGAWALRPPGDF